ncbi:MAG TPA: DUF1802 family protein [Gemmataceae bacterium]|nr:DUF1802 family protein [Gemmataceae bacterium]
MLKHAFKEWAVICKALAEGKQALILRKGGIAEADDNFAIEHTRFWLFPTWTHQQQPAGLRPEALPLLEQVELERPPSGKVRLTHFAEVTGIYHVHSLVSVLLLAHLHLWSEETVRKRFAYRTPGLFVLPVRVWRAAEAFELPDTAYYQGCRSWVELERELPTEGATPVLPAEKMDDLHRSLDLLLNPIALA